MRSSLGTVFGSLPPMSGGNRVALEVILMVLVTALLQANSELGVTATLFQLYSLLRSSTSPGEHRRLFAALIKDLPPNIQEDIRRKVYGLTDAGSVLLTELLAVQSRAPEDRPGRAVHPGAQSS
jgi:hypothetical protein